MDTWGWMLSDRARDVPNLEHLFFWFELSDSLSRTWLSNRDLLIDVLLACLQSKGKSGRVESYRVQLRLRVWVLLNNYRRLLLQNRASHRKTVCFWWSLPSKQSWVFCRWMKFRGLLSLLRQNNFRQVFHAKASFHRLSDCTRVQIDVVLQSEICHPRLSLGLEIRVRL